jgi:putative resolvase
MSYLSPGETAKYFNVSKETLRKWDDKGVIECIKTEGGHRRYKIPEKRDNRKIIYTPSFK